MSTVQQWDTCRKHVYTVSPNRINSQTEHPPALYGGQYLPVKLPCPSLQLKFDFVS